MQTTLQTHDIPGTITDPFVWQALTRRHEPRRMKNDVTGRIASLWTERDNLVHVLLETADGLVEVEAYAGFLYEPSPDGRMANVGDTVDLIHEPRLGGFVRNGWQVLAVERAFEAVRKAWEARDLAIKTDTALPGGIYDLVRVSDFFGVLFEDEPTFADDDAA